MRVIDEGDRIGFTGHWREFLPIAATNVLLTIVTLGFYRFWASARTRSYLWSRTYILDEPLAWAGTGKELFRGFVLTMLVTWLPFLCLQYATGLLAASGNHVISGILGMVAFGGLLYFAGVARFRSVRYRLSRSYWRGIRGGSDRQGFDYGLIYLVKTVLGYLTLGVMVPWAMMSLWNRRMNAMSFGSFAFSAHGRARRIFFHFLPFFTLPFVALFALYIVAASAGWGGGGVFIYADAPVWLKLVAVLVVLIGSGIIVGLMVFVYRAAFFREAIENLQLDTLSFGFDANTDDWIALFIGDAVLLIATLGLGYPFVTYRHWRFYARHLRMHGEVDALRLTQSTVRVSRHGEGLADVFDAGAF